MELCTGQGVQSIVSKICTKEFYAVGTLMDTVVFDLQVIGSHLAFINKLVHSLSEFLQSRLECFFKPTRKYSSLYETSSCLFKLPANSAIVDKKEFHALSYFLFFALVFLKHRGKKRLEKWIPCEDSGSEVA